MFSNNYPNDYSNTIPKPINVLDDNTIKSFILSGCYFIYESYDHNKAKFEYLKTINNGLYLEDVHSYMIPYELKYKYKVLRIGKLRSLDIAPNGRIRKMRIGNKRARVFYPSDIGACVKPILNPSYFDYSLFSDGYAINCFDIIYKNNLNLTIHDMKKIREYAVIKK